MDLSQCLQIISRMEYYLFLGKNGMLMIFDVQFTMIYMWSPQKVQTAFSLSNMGSLNVDSPFWAWFILTCNVCDRNLSSLFISLDLVFSLIDFENYGISIYVSTMAIAS